jgi:CheY-like chemotaxis protein
MNTELTQCPRRILLVEPDPAQAARWREALEGKQFEVTVIPPKLEPLPALHVLQGTESAPSLVLIAISWFVAHNRNPYPFARAVAAQLPHTSVAFIQAPKLPVTDQVRQLAQRYGAVDMVEPPAHVAQAASAIEALWFSVCATRVNGPSGTSAADTLTTTTSTQSAHVTFAATLMRALGDSAKASGPTQGWFTGQAALEAAARFGADADITRTSVEALLADAVLQGDGPRFDAKARYAFFHCSAKPAKASSAKPAGKATYAQGLDPETIAQLMQRGADAGGVDVRDRTFKFKQYPQCFIGAEATDWLAQHYSLTRPEAVQLGARLMEAGLIRHVVDEQEFADELYFYRFSSKQEAKPVDITALESEAVAAAMKAPDGIAIADRWYLLTVYPQCFLGSDAVAWLQKRYKISRPQALRLGSRLFDEGVIRHVVDEQKFEDKAFFYRFN